MFVNIAYGVCNLAGKGVVSERVYFSFMRLVYFKNSRDLHNYVCATILNEVIRISVSPFIS